MDDDPATKAARIMFHRNLDPLWRESPSPRARGRAYAWLAGQLGLPVERCHGAQFDQEMCERAIAVIRAAFWDRDPVPTLEEVLTSACPIGLYPPP